MEDILDVYHLPYDPYYPVVCMDESCKQMLDLRYKKAIQVRLVMDNLNTHNISFV